MTFKLPILSGRPNGAASFRKLRRPDYRPASAGVLTPRDLRQIVAEMLG
jgi:hypothetical protein